jgi:hypothetical protein
MKLLKYIWQLPQNIIGLAISLRYRRKGYKTLVYNDRLITYWDSHAGLSLGKYIFVNELASKFTIKHEYGHTKQSLMLGWLYLLVIGLPSYIWCNCFENYRRKHNVSYYDFYTERWANELADKKQL